MSARLPGALLLVSLFTAATASAQRPSEAELFGSPPEPGPDAGAAVATTAESADAGDPSGRPSEADLFGGGQGGDATGTAPVPAEVAPQNVARPNDAADDASNRDEALLQGGEISRNKFETGEADPDDPLKIGGGLYMRAVANTQFQRPPKNASFSAPTLLDTFMDARPSDRIRGYVLGRLRFDPALDPTRQNPFAVFPSNTGASITPVTTNPSVALDQLWLRFDIERVAYLTIGKQHVKWGTSRFWNPTDYLSPQRRDPLATFDERLGASIVKLHVPLEDSGHNFYALALLDNNGPANNFDELGGALRAEFSLLDAEVSASAVFQGKRQARYGVDFTAPLGPLDVYGEFGLKPRAEVPVFRERETPDPSLGPDALFERYDPGAVWGASGGATYSFAYTENDIATVGLEYFYNSVGVDTPALYPYLLYVQSQTGQTLFTPFSLGRHYGAFYAVLLGPGSWDRTSFIFSTLGNLSDKSFVSRLDFNVRVLTYLSFEAFFGTHYGFKGGEFRFGLDLPSFTLSNGQTTPAVSIPAPLFDMGIGLRIDI